MIRVSKEITTGRILCSQGGAFPDDATMIANARSAFPDMLEEEIEVVDLTEEEFAAALAAQNAPTLEQAKATSNNWSIDAVGVVGTDLEFVAIRMRDESEV